MDLKIDRRNLLGRALVAGLSIPLLRASMVAAEAAEDPFLRLVHPELRPLATRILQGAAAPLSAGTLARDREGANAMARPRIADIPVETKVVPALGAQPAVKIHVVNAKAGERRPAILHMHGGGFVSGSAASQIRGLQELCRALDCVAVTVEYRLAPETTWRGSVEDNYVGLKWLHAHAEQIGADPARIAVMGESAGGGHAALLAIAARDRGEIPIAFQCLVYPMLDDRTGSARPVPAHVGRLVWTAESNRFAWASFLGTRPGGQSVPARAVPARVQDFSGLPPAFIGVGSLDLFHDEDVEYARRLNAAGCSTELIVVPGAFHGFDIIPPPTRVAAWFNAAKLEALRRGLGLANPG